MKDVWEREGGAGRKGDVLFPYGCRQELFGLEFPSFPSSSGVPAGLPEHAMRCHQQQRVCGSCGLRAAGGGLWAMARTAGAEQAAITSLLTGAACTRLAMDGDVHASVRSPPETSRLDTLQVITRATAQAQAPHTNANANAIR